MYDLLIKNGRVVDGSGAPAYPADVAVRSEKIVAVGQLEEEAAKVIDAGGQIVSPGFIDPHTHSDFSFLLDPTAQSKVRQGVTVELSGSCGLSIAPLQGEAYGIMRNRVAQYGVTLEPTWQDFAGYLEALERKGASLNQATQVGHGTVRACVLGLDARAPSGEEQEQMQALVAESLDAGALGFSTGLFYAPSNYARLEEVIELARAAAERGKLYSSHIRDEGDQSVGLFVALNEAIEVGRRTGVSVQVSHVKCMGPAVASRAGDVLKLFEEARKEGIDMAGDQYPYTAGSTSLTGALFPRWALAGGRKATLQRLQDPAQRQRIHSDIHSAFGRASSPADFVIASYPADRNYEGRNIAQVAEEAKVEPAEAATLLYQRGEGMLIIHGLQEADVELIARHPIIAVGSDGSSLSAQGVLSAGKPHPRNYGTAPRYLARFVREKKLVSLEEAIRKMTLLPASRLGLARRGRIVPGWWADLVVFDDNTVEDTATFTDPHRYPKGIPHVAVNGTLVIENGEFTGKTPGKVLRRGTD